MCPGHLEETVPQGGRAAPVERPGFCLLGPPIPPWSARPGPRAVLLRYHAGGVLRVHIQAAGAAHHQQAGVRAGQDVAQVLEGGAVLGQGVLGSGPKGVDDHVVAR